MNLSTYSEETGYVNIHGQDIKVFTCDKTGRIVVPIDELKKMGFRLYLKSQYCKLLVDDKQFTDEFNLYMLEMAQEYMITHKMSFTDDQILESINRLKRVLKGEESKSPAPQTNFTQNHVVEKQQNGDISITTHIKEHQRSPHGSSGPSFGRARAMQNSFSEPKPDSTRLSNTKSFVTKENHEPKVSEIPSNTKTFSPKQNHEPKVNESWSSLSSDQQLEKKSSPESSKFSENKRNNMNRNGRVDAMEIPEKIPSIDFENPKHKVIVSFAEKHNVFWVQDLDRVDELLGIGKEIENAIARAKTISGRFILNTIYLAQHEDEWFRCKIIRFKPLTVLFLDYGNSAECSDLKEAPESLRNIPGQAVRITTTHTSVGQFEANAVLTIRIMKKFENGTYLVEPITDDEFDTKPTKVNSPKNDTKPTKVNSPKNDTKPTKVNTPKETPQPVASQSFSGKPPQFGNLEHDQRIMVIAHMNGQLVLRTKESFERLKQIEKRLDDMHNVPVNSVVKGQLVLVKTDKVKRAIVLNVENDNIEVELLDYNQIKKIDIIQVYKIPADLANEKLTYIVSPQIRGYTKDNDAVIDELVQKQVKGSVVLRGQDFDLKISNGLLSEKFQPAVEPKRPSLRAVDPNRPLLENFEIYKPSIGVNALLFNTFRDRNKIYFGVEELLMEHLESIVKNDLPGGAYEPVVGEVCFGLYQDAWSRCVIRETTKTHYNVLFIDFGNEENLDCSQLRPLSDDAKNVPVLGIRCKLLGLPNVDEELLKTSFEESETYQVEVKRFNGSAFEIDIPSLYEKF